MAQSTAAIVLTVLVVIIVICIVLEKQWSDMCYTRSTLNGKEYLVRNRPDKQRAADLLAATHQKLEQASKMLAEQHGDDWRVQRLLKRFPNTTLAESDGSSKHTSYSVNKGEKIVLCLRSKNGNQPLEDPNLLLFVALHEISHIMTKSIGHTKEFWNNFKFVLQNCQQAGIYKCVDFSSQPQQYCGITVTNSPVPCFR